MLQIARVFFSSLVALPIDDIRDALLQAAVPGARVLLKAPTGSGKSTTPPVCGLFLTHAPRQGCKPAGIPSGCLYLGDLGPVVSLGSSLSHRLQAGIPTGMKKF